MTLGFVDRIGERLASTIISHFNLPTGLTDEEAELINIYTAAGDTFAAHRLRV